MQPSAVNPKSSQKKIKRHFKNKSRQHYNKVKAPKADCYPIINNDPYLVLDDPKGFESLFLVGSNWTQAKHKPIAIIYGCNNWKLGFLSEYLSDYRTAFIPRKYKKSISCWQLLRKLSQQPEKLFIWSYTENYAVRSYARKHQIPISRIEDGFLRSSSLGASHSTPLSLVIDDQDLFFNSKETSKLEGILNTYDFSSNPKLLENAQTCLDTLLSLKLSKYNNPEFIETPDKLNLKLKRKVGVIGQVDNDAAIRLGNPDNWSFEDLVRLACYENPDAEVIYRPHPEIYRGYQKNRLKREEISQIATIAPPEGPLWDFLDEVDQVYTISSLSGFEALIRGIKVTTVGIPFYGGWGLTDDRAQFSRRNRTCTLQEAFAAIYLLYPTYLSNKDDSYIGFLTACYAIKADQEIELNQEAATKTDSQVYRTNELWALHLFKTKPKAKDIESALKAIPLHKLFHKEHQDSIYQLAFPLLVISNLASNDQKFDFLLEVKNFISHEAFSELITYCNNLLPNSYIQSIYANYLSQDVHSKSSAIDTLSSIGLETIDSEPVQAKSPKLILTDIETLISLGLNEEALKKTLGLIPVYKNYPTLIQLLIKLSELLLDYESTLRFSKLLQALSINHSNRLGTAAEIKASLLTAPATHAEKMLLLAKTIKLKPELYGLCQIYIKQFPETFNEEDDSKTLNALLYTDNDFTYRKALGYIAAENAPKACEILESLIANGDRSAKLAVTYSQALSYSNRLNEAESVISKALDIHFVQLVIHEYIRICILKSQYIEALSVISRAEANAVVVGDMHKRKVYFGNRKVEEAFETFTQIRAAKALHKYFSEKYIFGLDQIQPLNKVILLSLYGPGDEIRFASIYHKLSSLFAGKELTISATPRLIELFSRSFPAIDFVPVDRPRKTDRIDPSDYNLLPGSDIIDIVDNNATQLVEEYDGVALATDFLHHFLKSYDDFERTPYLKACSAKVEQLRLRLPLGKKLVGISWRSSLTTHSRNEHYLTIEQLLPLFEIDGLTFVNLQYDDCESELEYVEQLHPGKLINLPDIDQYNDFDSVAALMSCMDLVISPATTVVELAGSLGIPTWLFANSSELHWRRLENSNCDVWHGSCEIVEGEILGSHTSLVDRLVEKLTEYAST
jgi:capsular polysaccharide export protein